MTLKIVKLSSTTGELSQVEYQEDALKITPKMVKLIQPKDKRIDIIDYQLALSKSELNKVNEGTFYFYIASFNLSFDELTKQLKEHVLLIKQNLISRLSNEIDRQKDIINLINLS